MESTLTIRRVPLGSLHADPANARLHDEHNLETIRASLARFGQAEPLVVHKRTGRVIGGNGRLTAMRSMGWTECRRGRAGHRRHAGDGARNRVEPNC